MFYLACISQPLGPPLQRRSDIHTIGPGRRGQRWGGIQISDIDGILSRVLTVLVAARLRRDFGVFSPLL